MPLWMRRTSRGSSGAGLPTLSAGHSATTSSLTVLTLALSGMLSGPVERTGTGSGRGQDLAFECVEFGARSVEHPEGGVGGWGAARCGDVGARDVPRFAERPARDPRRARRCERDGNPRAYRPPGARLGARGDPSFAKCPATVPRWRTNAWKRSGAVGVRAGRAPMSTPSGILKRISASVIASCSSSR